MHADQHVMISIRAQHAADILAGSKTVELRRRFMPLPAGTQLWIYSTLPVGALVATAHIFDVEYATPASLWTSYKHDVAVSKKVFFDYFADCKLGCAIRLKDIERITPIPLSKIRQIRGVSQIPQVAVKISDIEAKEFSRYGELQLA